MGTTPLATPDASETLWYRACRGADSSLKAAAEQLLQQPEAELDPSIAPELLRYLLRVSGSPLVAPRAWYVRFTAEGTAAAQMALRDEVSKSFPGRAPACGIARHEADERKRLVLIAGDPLAALEPVPTQVERGASLHLNVHLDVPATRPELVWLAPSGLPTVRPMSEGGAHARLDLVLDQPGQHLLQVLADIEGGPRPLLEIYVHVATPPPERYLASPAPGESTASKLSPAEHLHAMINGARAHAGLAALTPHPALARVAQEHASRMAKLKRVEHDLGLGNPAQRIEQAGLVAIQSAENVAKASGARQAHRLTWQSPAHRSNLLGPHYDSIGIGVAIGEDGVLYVCELFARLR